MSIKTRLTAFLMLIIAALVLSACGGNGNVANQPPSANDEDTSNNVQPEVIEDSVQLIRDRGVVVVGTEAAYEPFEFIRDGEIVGYGSDILAHVVEELGVELDQLDTPFQGILPGLDMGRFDFVATSMTITEQRLESYDFTVPIAEGTASIMKRKGDDSIQSAEDLAGKVVGVQLNSGPAAAVERFNEELIAQGEGFKETKEYVSYPDAYQDLAAGRVDAIVQGLPALSQTVKNRPDEFEIVGRIGEPTYLAWMVRKGDTAMQQLLNEVIIGLKESGELADMQMEWFGFLMDVPEEMYELN